MVIADNKTSFNPAFKVSFSSVVCGNPGVNIRESLLGNDQRQFTIRTVCHPFLPKRLTHGRHGRKRNGNVMPTVDNPNLANQVHFGRNRSLCLQSCLYEWSLKTRWLLIEFDRVTVVLFWVAKIVESSFYIQTLLVVLIEYCF